MYIQNFAFITFVSTVIGAAGAYWCDAFFSANLAQRPVFFWIRALFLLIGFVFAYSVNMLLILATATDLVLQRTVAHWSERLKAAIEARKPDVSFRDLLDHAAWCRVQAHRLTYAFGRWEFFGRDG